MRPLYLVDEKVRARALEAVRSAPLGYKLMLGPAGRNLDQNARCHACLGEIGSSLDWKWAGINVDIEDIKSVFMSAYRKSKGGNVRFLPGIDGEPVLLNWRTRDLSKADMSEFIEMLEAYIAEKETA